MKQLYHAICTVRKGSACRVSLASITEERLHAEIFKSNIKTGFTQFSYFLTNATDKKVCREACRSEPTIANCTSYAANKPREEIPAIYLLRGCEAIRVINWDEFLFFFFFSSW